MLDPAKLKQQLTSSGIPQQAVARAEQHAGTKGIALADALVELDIAQHPQVGKCLSEVSQVPYKPLLQAPPSPHARGLLSPNCAYKWQVFPHSYQPQMGLLTMAAHDPDQMAMMEAIHNFFMQPFRLAFTIAGPSEIKQAFETHLGLKAAPAPAAAPASDAAAPPPADKPAKRSLKMPGKEPEKTETAPESEPSDSGKPLSGLAAALKKKQEEKAARGDDKKAPMASVRTQRRKKPADKTKKEPEEPEPKKADARKPQDKDKAEKTESAKAEPEKEEAADLSHSLISAAALLVGAHLGDDSEKLATARSRVRYCQLLATKLGLPTTDIDQVVLGAWMSALRDKRQVIKQFVTPYNLEDVIFTDDVEDSGLPPAAQVLKLVTCYQEMKERDPESCKDVNLTRRSLRLLWSSADESQNMLEMFLQLLMDEEFLSKLDSASGNILIVDPVEVSTSSLAPPLTNDGYEVTVVPTAAAAEGAIAESAPDLVIAAFDLPQTNGLKFSQKLKRGSDTSSIPVVIILKPEEEKHVAECLRAGVDDYIVRPVNLELLFLKTQKLVSAVPTEATKEGVSGSLEDMSFTDMIQILCAGAKSMEIDLVCDGTEGKVFVKNGEIIHSSVGDSQGEEAFYKLMQWTRGDFTTKQCAEFPEPTIDSSTMSLLMEGARIADEGE